MLVTDDTEMARRVRYLSTQAREPVVHYEHTELGFNYRMSNLLAAVGTAQLAGLPAKMARRRHINAVYRDELGDLPGVSFMPIADYGQPNCWLTCLTIDSTEARADRDTVLKHLAHAGIEARPVWKPMHLQPLYAEAGAVAGACAERLFDTGMCLPSGSSLGSDGIERVVSTVHAVLA
jgi:dTDP-4-amino-4,6-dideoxygalactose transaminase